MSHPSVCKPLQCRLPSPVAAQCVVNGALGVSVPTRPRHVRQFGPLSPACRASGAAGTIPENGEAASGKPHAISGRFVRVFSAYVQGKLSGCLLA